MDNDDYDTAAPHHEPFMKKVLQVFRWKRSKSISEEEVKQLLEEGTRSGAIDTAEHELIKSIFEFTDTTVKEIMVPRTDIVAVELSTPRDRLINMLIEEGFSRIPVYEGSTDNIVGIIYTKDLLSMLEYRDLIILQDIIRPAYFVPETKKISSLLRELQLNRQHMAIVVDEFGGTEGLITMEDIIEEIVGDIQDEFDTSVEDVLEIGEKTYLCDARVSIADLNEILDLNLPNDDFDTLGGFVFDLFGKIPVRYEKVAWRGAQFIVQNMDGYKIRTVKVQLKAEAAPEGAE